MSSPEGPIGVLVMAYGTPSSPAKVEEFYTDVRRGRPPSPEQLADLVRRYDAIGGISPLAERTDAQVAGIQAALDRRSPGRYCCRLGTKHSTPRLERAVGELADLGARRIVGIVLAPHYSRGSVGEYVERAERAAADSGLTASFVTDWHDDPVLVELLAERVRAAVASMAPVSTEAIASGTFLLLVTAHSLPLRVVGEGARDAGRAGGAGGTGDPYVAQLRRTAELVAEAAEIGCWQIGWQSAGRTPEPWLGPDILERLRQLPGENVSAVVVCPAGFTSDHLEVLFDLDVDAARVAAEVGLAFARTASLNDDPRLCDALAALVSDMAESHH